MTPRVTAALGLGIIGAALFAGSPRAEDLAAEQILRRGNGSEPQTLDPQLSENTQDAHIERDLFEGLVTLNRRNQVEAAAASAWTISDDGLTYRLTLRPDLKWSNGEPLTAEDFVYSFRRAVTPATGSHYSFIYYPIKNAEEIASGKLADPTALGIRAIDPQTLEITLKAPTGYFIKALAHHAFLPLNRHCVEQFGATFTRPGNLITNGAFTLKEWTPQSRIVLVKNPNYWDAATVKLNEVDFYPIENQNEEFKRYRANELDTTNEIPRDQIDQIHADFKDDLRIFPYLSAYYYGFNLEQPPFKDNLKLRTALAMAVDRDVLTQKILKTGEIPKFNFIPDGIADYTPQLPEWAAWSQADRVAAAKKLYAEAGYGPGKPLRVELMYNTSETHKKIAIAVAAMWRQALGVETTLANQEFKVFLDTRRAKKLTQVYRAGWVGDYADPNTFLELLQPEVPLNDMGYDNPEYDALVKKSAITVDPAAREALMEQAERLVSRDLPMMPLYQQVNPALIKPWVQGFSKNILGWTYDKNVSIVQH
jgi:oligopeptide transport system substrate-binding protein